MKVKDVLEQREQGLEIDSSPQICHLWGIYSDQTAPGFSVNSYGYHAVEGSGGRVLTTFGITGAFPVALLYRGTVGSYVRFELIPQYQLLTGAWAFFPEPHTSEPAKCSVKIWQKLKNGRLKNTRLTMRFYYCYSMNSIKPLKPDDWISRKLISIAEGKLECPILK